MAAMLMIGLQASAQTEAPASDKVEQRAKALTDEMKTKLPLDDAAYPKVYEINLKYAKKMQELKAGSEGKLEKIKAMRSNKEDKNEELKAVLNESQYAAYTKMMEEKRAAMKAKRKERRK